MLTTTDLDVITASASDGNIFTQYYFNGWKMHPWQLLFHHANQPNITIIGGVGSGKTVGAAVSAAVWCASVENFYFMDIAPTSWQASLMYDFVLRVAQEGTYFDKFVTEVRRKPYPEIVLYNGSKLQFMTAQDDITRIRGWEGDWMHLDEGGFLETFATTIGIMRTRLRAQTTAGRARLGRLSVTTTATDNTDLWDRFDRAIEDPKTYLSFTVRTQDNPVLSATDLRLMRADIPEELQGIEMEGDRPMGRGVFFPIHVVDACQDSSINSLAADAAAREIPGAVYEETGKLGLMRFSLPYVPFEEYLIVGDPGIGNAPRRNCGVIAVFRITGFPTAPGSKVHMVAFAWVSGNGRYEPFEHQFKTWWEYYRCGMNAAIESTGPQKSFAEYAFTLGLDGQQMWVYGVDMSGNKKSIALQACMQLFQRGLFRIPLARGIRNQLVGFKLPDTKIAQDIVSMFLAAAAWLRESRVWLSIAANASDEELTEAETISTVRDYAGERDLRRGIDRPR